MTLMEVIAADQRCATSSASPSLCPACGHILDARRQDGTASRMGLVVGLDPPVACWRHGRLLLPSPTCLRYLYLLVRWGVVSADWLSRTTQSEAVMPATVHAHVTHLRKWLRDNDLPVIIVPIHRFGYQIARRPNALDRKASK
jgi:hypothetical protein